MGLLTRDQIETALSKLGALAGASGKTIEFVVVGGAAMVLGFDARLSTHDVDAIVLPPYEAAEARQFAATVAFEMGWPDDWLNDAAKGFLKGRDLGQVVFEDVGIRVYQPPITQLLAMKLSAWRDDVDINDAAFLLRVLKRDGSRAEIWKGVQTYLIPGRELTAKFAFDDLWESEA